MTYQIGGLNGRTGAASLWLGNASNAASRKDAFPYDTETIERRKKDPALDRAMYLEELAAVTGEQSQLEILARKVARGERLTPDEEQLIKDKNPDLLKKAVEAREEAKRLKARADAARTPAEAQAVISQASAQAAAAVKGGDPLGGALRAEAIQSVQNRQDQRQRDGRLGLDIDA